VGEGKRAGRGVADRAYNEVLERLVLPCGDLVLRTEFMRTLRHWRQIQHLPSGELASLQADGLRHLLEHATARVPYYRSVQVQPDADPHEWLRRFPILTKQELRAEGEDLLTPGVGNLVECASSGSSGIQSTVWMTPAEMSRAQAIQTLWWEWAGYRLGDRLLQTGITPDRGWVKSLKDRLLRTTYVTAFGLTDRQMLDVLEQGRDHPWDHFGGYASSVDAFAQAAGSHGMGDITFGSVISWGDKMFDHYRRRVEAQFSTTVHDTYGTTEGLCVAAQCRSSEYYVMTPHVVLELLDDSWEPVQPGEIGRVVVTRLDATAMPLIRYYLGDLAVAPVEPVRRAGRPAFPQLERIIGRDTDTIRTAEGRVLTVHTFTGVFEFAPSIEQFSIVPDDKGLVVEYIPAKDFLPHVIDEVSNRLNSVVGEIVPLRWKAVDHIPDSPSGKPQIIRPKRV
jgi:phenylacetate-CoA ligase